MFIEVYTCQLIDIPELALPLRISLIPWMLLNYLIILTLPIIKRFTENYEWFNHYFIYLRPVSYVFNVAIFSDCPFMIVPSDFSNVYLNLGQGLYIHIDLFYILTNMLKRIILNVD